ncbi:PREDICTED: protein rough sheath 2 homolog [Nelumbo nucifera]|uniref:Protein rough sheath 2 homolog n=2 Tax=Nelumbo nucifera TaxID=4432 RepID=A0A822YRZ0_NELNU|nr:PREDICTED: protein rough sheath 2 homolog [Nelumbo nucifera]DAD35280.1 TPA_asm: hypothetical protein HUJ06_005920 [Nelumbo nucifera]
MKERQRWQPEEDALLRAYVKKYGPKEWNLVSQRMGKPHDRDAKSCLERWKNYLKPGIKKGSLTLEEQNLVISLQAKYGNKWKKIASEVPGRTAKRLGKWWEVFKAKQLKLQQQQQHQKTHQQQRPLPSDYPDPSTASSIPPPTTTLHGQYDHILETFAEKYVQPKLLKLQQRQPQPSLLPPSLLMPSHLSLPEAPPPILSLSTTVLPAWMNTPNLVSSTPSLSSSSSTTPSPSVSHLHSPQEPTCLDSVSQEMGLTHQRFFTLHEMGVLAQYCKEIEEGKKNLLQRKKEATWRLNRLEQQLESEKARKMKEKMEEVEAKIRCLRNEEIAYLDKIENECEEQLKAIQIEEEAKEAKMVEAWCSKQVKLAKLVKHMGIHRFHLTKNLY